MQNWLLQSRQYHQSLCCGWYQLTSTQCHVNADFTGLAELSILQRGWCHSSLCSNAAVSKLWLVEVGSTSSCMLCGYCYLWSDPHSFFILQLVRPGKRYFFTSNMSRLTGTHSPPSGAELRMSGAMSPLPHILPWHTQRWLYLYIAFTVSSLPLTLLVLFSTSFSFIAISCFI
jgi:hypothetical protein